jgi:hypothetical protein
MLRISEIAMFHNHHFMVTVTVTVICQGARVNSPICSGYILTSENGKMIVWVGLWVGQFQVKCRYRGIMYVATAIGVASSFCCATWSQGCNHNHNHIYSNCARNLAQQRWGSIPFLPTIIPDIQYSERHALLCLVFLFVYLLALPVTPSSRLVSSRIFLSIGTSLLSDPVRTACDFLHPSFCVGFVPSPIQLSLLSARCVAPIFPHDLTQNVDIFLTSSVNGPVLNWGFLYLRTCMHVSMWRCVHAWVNVCMFGPSASCRMKP